MFADVSRYGLEHCRQGVPAQLGAADPEDLRGRPSVVSEMHRADARDRLHRAGLNDRTDPRAPGLETGPLIYSPLLPVRPGKVDQNIAIPGTKIVRSIARTHVLKMYERILTKDAT